MNILIVSTVDFQLHGISSVIMNYFRNIDKTEINADLVVNGDIHESYRLELQRDNIRVFTLKRKSRPFKYQMELYRIMKKNNYDLIHVHGNSSLMVFDLLPAIMAGIPVRIAHSHNTTCIHKVLHRMLKPLFLLCYTHGFACSQAAGKWLFGNRPFIVIKNGIELNTYRYNEEVRRKYREIINAENKIVLGHVGNFVEQKNHDFLLNIFAELIKNNQDYKLLLIGDGYLLEEMEEKAAKLKLTDSVLFIGKTTEVYNYLQAMDIFMLPSLYEGLPVVLIEAQAAGVPCIAADTISRESDLTGGIQFLSIADIKDWCESIKKTRELIDLRDRKKISDDWQRKIAEAGYDVIQSAGEIRKLYIEYVS